MSRYTRFVCISFLFSAASFSEATAQQQHEQIVSRNTTGPILVSDEGMHTSNNLNGWCRRCLRIQEDEAPPLSVPADAPSAADPANGAVPTSPAATVDLPSLPSLPSDAPTDGPPSPRTNPSTLLTPSGMSSPRATSVNHPSGVAGKVGLSAGVGLTAGVGFGVLLLGVLYFFKPDLFFLCCKTCVQVQVFHHAAAAANPKK